MLSSRLSSLVDVQQQTTAVFMTPYERFRKSSLHAWHLVEVLLLQTWYTGSTSTTTAVQYGLVCAFVLHIKHISFTLSWFLSTRGHPAHTPRVGVY